MGKTSDKTVYKTTGWCGFGSGSNTAAVDTKDGRIARIRPLHLDDKYTEEELNPWKIEVRGHTLTSASSATKAATLPRKTSVWMSLLKPRLRWRQMLSAYLAKRPSR